MSSSGSAIAFFSSSASWGGLEMNLVRWAHWLSQEGEEVRVFCKKDSKLYVRAKKLKLPVVLISGHQKYYDVKAAWKLAKLFRKKSCTRVVFRDTKDMSVLALAKTFSGNKLGLFYFQGMRIGVSKRDLLHTVRFRKLDRWITPLNVLKTEVTKYTRFKSEKISVIPLAVDDSFRPDRSADDVRNELGVKPSHLLLGVIGRLDPGKCQDTVIQAISNLKDHSEVKLLILGDETANSEHNYKEYLEELITKHKLEDTVIMRSATSKVASFMNALDVFIMSSKAETFGMVTIEALWLNKIVIGTNSGGTPELLNNGEHGLLVEPEDAAELAKSIELIRSDRTYYALLAERAGAEAKTKYAKATFVKALLSELKI